MASYDIIAVIFASLVSPKKTKTKRYQQASYIFRTDVLDIFERILYVILHCIQRLLFLSININMLLSSADIKQHQVETGSSNFGSQAMYICPLWCT